jgi:ribonuclease HI
LKILLKLAAQQGIQNLQVFGDSQIVINWIHGKYRMENLFLSPIFAEVKNSLSIFNTISFDVYRELNREADSQSKAGIQMAEGTGSWLKVKDGNPIQEQHFNFII